MFVVTIKYRPNELNPKVYGPFESKADALEFTWHLAKVRLAGAEVIILEVLPPFRFASGIGESHTANLMQSLRVTRRQI